VLYFSFRFEYILDYTLQNKFLPVYWIAPFLLNVWLLIREELTLNVSSLSERQKYTCISTFFSVSAGEISVDELQEEEKKKKISSHT